VLESVSFFLFSASVFARAGDPAGLPLPFSSMGALVLLLPRARRFQGPLGNRFAAPHSFSFLLSAIQCVALAGFTDAPFQEDSLPFSPGKPFSLYREIPLPGARVPGGEQISAASESLSPRGSPLKAAVDPDDLFIVDFDEDPGSQGLA